MTDLDSAIEAFRAAERSMGAARRTAAKGQVADKAGVAQVKRAAAQQVKDAAAGLERGDLTERQRRDVRRAIDYLRLAERPKGEAESRE